MLTILNNLSCKYSGTHLAINRGRRAQCRPRFFSPPHEPPHLVYKRSRRPLPAVLTRARSRSRKRDRPAPRRDRALPSAPRRAGHPASPPRPHCCSVLAGFAASTLAPSALPLFALTTSCRSPRRRPSLRDAATALLAYKRSEAVMSPIISPSTPSRFAPLAEPLLTSPAHSRDEAPTVDPLPRAVPCQGEMAGSSRPLTLQY